VLTLQYVQPLEELDAKAQEDIATLDAILKQMVDYSILVARLNKEENPEAERIELFAEYLEGLRSSIDRGSLELPLSVEERASIIADVRAQETLLDAMAAAQPMINRVAQVAAITVRELRMLEVEYDQAVGDAIEADFQETLAFRRKAGHERDTLLAALGRIYDFRRGDASALDAVLTGPALPEVHRPRFDRDDPELDIALERYLTQRYEEVMNVIDRLRPELEHYAALQAELDGILASFDAELRATWGVIFVWSRAHQRMASGVVDPAQWFDVKDAPSSIFRLAGRAL